MADTFKPYGLNPADEYFLEKLTGKLFANGLIPKFNLTLAQEWYDREQREFTARQANKPAGCCTFGTDGLLARQQ